MMNINYFLIFIYILITSCNENKKNFKVKKDIPDDSCSVNEENFSFEFFPFNLNDFKLSNMLTHLDKKTKVDSVMNDKKFYYFDNSPSKFSIIVYSNGKAYIDGGSIKSNFFLPKNGVKIGMGRHEFFKLIKNKDNNCSTFTIIENSMMYHFSFKDKRLHSIDFDGL